MLAGSAPRFFKLARNSIAHDFWNFRTIEEDEVCKYEELFSSAEYCFEKVSYLIGEEIADYRDIIGKSLDQNFNRHNFGKVGTASQIFQRWPEQFKRIFMSVINAIGIDDVLQTYGLLKYDESVSIIEDYRRENQNQISDFPENKKLVFSLSGYGERRKWPEIVQIEAEKSLVETLVQQNKQLRDTYEAEIQRLKKQNNQLFVQNMKIQGEEDFSA